MKAIGNGAGNTGLEFLQTKMVKRKRGSGQREKEKNERDL